ncbi:MAG TPA: tetratricopeptide repeat protein [Terriglobales bacterium]|nr:tetratricopeptide repeat protein [Terriglobales bacterium]
MKTALAALFFAAWVPLAFGGPCTGAEAQLAQVSRQLARGEPDAAEQVLGSIAPSYPACPDVLLQEARIVAARGDAATAGGMFMRYLEVAPDDSRGYTYFGRFLISQRQYDRADRASEVAIQKAPNDPGALALRGQLLDMKGESQKGLEMLNRACQLDPENVDAQFYLGTIFDRAKRPDEAVKHFQKVVSIDQRDARAWDYLALNLEPLGKLDAADEAYRKALDVNSPGAQFDAFLDYNYGRFLVKRNDLADAKKHLDRAVELVPQARSTWYERAKLNLRLGDYKQARSDAEKAASLQDPAGVIIDLQLYSLLEQIYRHLGEKELAAKYAELARTTPIPSRGDHR